MFECNRYLTRFDTTRTPHILTDILVIGSGIAGLRASLAAAKQCRVLLVAKSELQESNTWYAQGGIAAALGSSASRDSHFADTLKVSCGIGDRRAIRHLVDCAPDRVEELLQWGVPFDRSDGVLDFAREGAHSQPRVLHAKGDATGEALVDTLIKEVHQDDHIRVFEHCYVIDLLTAEGHCVGAITYHQRYGHQLIWAKQTILASGGCGRVYRETTNPEVASGDGHAMAYRAGALLQDMEMLQFHPTTLYVAGASRALISEAVRGEGGKIVDRTGERFMGSYHLDAELAPRDVVSRSILNQMIKTESTCVFLDVRQFEAGRFVRRFPGIAKLCREFGIDPETDLIPVRPSAHYMIGGVRVDLRGATSLPGLWACGEVTSSGIHGANRLASNSLLEGLVYGEKAGRAAGETAATGSNRPRAIESHPDHSSRTRLDVNDVARSLRSLMWRNVGIERSGPRLRETIEIGQMWAKYVMDKVLDSRFGWSVQNMLTLSLLMSYAALQRTESRGVHYRVDYPDRDDLRWRAHILFRRVEGGWSEFELSTSPVPES